MKFSGGCLQILLRTADGAVAVDRPCQVRPDVGVGNRFGALCKCAALLERIDPHFPVLSSHDLDGVTDLLFTRRFDGDVSHEPFVSINRLCCKCFFNGLEDGFVGFSRFGMRAAR